MVSGRSNLRKSPCFGISSYKHLVSQENSSKFYPAVIGHFQMRFYVLNFYNICSSLLLCLCLRILHTEYITFKHWIFEILLTVFPMNRSERCQKSIWQYWLRRTSLLSQVYLVNFFSMAFLFKKLRFGSEQKIRMEIKNLLNLKNRGLSRCIISDFCKAGKRGGGFYALN